MIERLGQGALSGQPIRFEEFVSGLGRWFDIYLARDGGVDSRRVISVFNNITERKQREANLRLLAEMSAAFAPLLTADDIMRRVGARLATLNLSRCNFSVVDLATGHIDCVYAWRRDAAMPELSGRHRILSFLNEQGLQHCAAGQVPVIDEVHHHPLLNASALGLFE